MSDIVIKAENLGKKYIIGHQTDRGRYTALRDVLMQKTSGLWHKTKNLVRGKPANAEEQEEFWALKELNFEIKRGETVGIIGRNGAGKSTLLKVLSRITEPSTGRVTIKGRVASLLEVGTGFHPELSGRENIYLNGAILGMTRAEIRRKFDEIVAFAETEKFLDTPVKRYSSGMYVRLAFAVAAHLEPEILIVDEVLAVGDAAFQKKCLSKMGSVANEGRSILFVSHNLVALRSLCTQAMWLDNGKLQDVGLSTDVVANYLQLQTRSLYEQIWDDSNSAPGNEMVRLHRVWIEPEEGSYLAGMPREKPLNICVEYWHLNPKTQLHITLHVYVEEQIVAFTTGSTQGSGWEENSRRKGLIRSTCKIPAYFFNTGQIRVKLWVIMDQSSSIYSLEDVLSFEIIETEKRSIGYLGKEPGVLSPKIPWETEYIGTD